MPQQAAARPAAWHLRWTQLLHSVDTDSCPPIDSCRPWSGSVFGLQEGILILQASHEHGICRPQATCPGEKNDLSTFIKTATQDSRTCTTACSYGRIRSGIGRMLCTPA